MAFFNSAVGVLQTLVVALGAGLGIWGAINLLEGYGNDNPNRQNCQGNSFQNILKSFGIHKILPFSGAVPWQCMNFHEKLFGQTVQGGIHYFSRKNPAVSWIISHMS